MSKCCDAWPVTDPGQMTERITFLRQVEVSDISGKSATWVEDSPPFQMWVKIDRRSAQETFRAGQDIGTILAEVTGVYNANVHDTMRFRSPSGGTWVIKAIRVLGHVQMVMTCVSLGATEIA